MMYEQGGSFYDKSRTGRMLCLHRRFECLRSPKGGVEMVCDGVLICPPLTAYSKQMVVDTTLRL